MKRVSIQNISGNEVDYTIILILLVKIMLCSKLRCQKYFKLEHILYEIRANLAHIRQSRPDAGLDFPVKSPLTLLRYSLFATESRPNGDVWNQAKGYQYHGVKTAMCGMFGLVAFNFPCLKMQDPKYFQFHIKFHQQRRSCAPERNTSVFFFFFITLGLELSDTKVYEP